MTTLTQKSDIMRMPLLGARDEREPLLVSTEVQEDLLSRVIFERCIANSVLLDPHSCARKIAFGTSVMTSLSAGASFIPVSLPLPAGALFAAANFVGFFKLDMWAIRGTIHDILGPKGEKEIVLLNRSSQGLLLLFFL